MGWDRRPDQEKSLDLSSTNTVVMRRDTRNGRATLFGQLRFAMHVIRSIRKIRPDVVCGVNEDTACLLVPFKHIFYRKLVCDIFDTLYDRHSNRSFPIRVIAWLMTFVGRTFSDELIVTDQNRLNRMGRYKSKSKIIENFPEDPGDAIANTLPQGAVKILVAGTLNSRRGLSQILSAIEQTEDVSIVSVGWPYDDFATDVFTKHPKVDFRGIVTLAESLAYAAQCDAVFAFYEPSSINNRNASPNKIYDAVSVGRPVIINTETTVSSWVREQGIGFVCDYDDVNSLAFYISGLKETRTELAGEVDRCRELFKKKFDWAIMEPVLLDIYSSVKC